MVTPSHGPAIPGWLARLYPFTPKSFQTAQGARMSYVDEGASGREAVLMLHGNPTWSFHFRDLVSELYPMVRCVAPDHVGMGLSDKPSSYDYGLASRIADIEGLVGSLGLAKVHLVVHDWGGPIGLGFAGRHPERVGRIVILNTAAFASDRIPLRISLCRTPWLGALIVRGLNGFAEAATWMATASRRLTWEERRAYLHPYDSWASRIGIHRFVRDIPLERAHPSRHALEEVSRGLRRLAGHEKMILWGARDFCFDDAFLSRWREIYPDARVERFENAGHYVLEDAGGDARDRIRDFLTRS
ncbi:MAG TPA: alpha/beta fold hydrolase [Opitutaceae bacterium]|nr:alpha/beta fold hydrolase [Opitutaceae bacterium]